MYVCVYVCVCMGVCMCEYVCVYVCVCVCKRDSIYRILAVSCFSSTVVEHSTHNHKTEGSNPIGIRRESERQRERDTQRVRERER
jgi:hypothetical protein